MPVFIPKPQRTQLFHKGTEGNATLLPHASQCCKTTILKASEDSCWSMDSGRGTVLRLLPLCMKNFCLLGGGPENRTALVLFTQ